MKITEDMLKHYGVSTNEELEEMILSDSEKYHNLTLSYYQQQAENKIKEKEQSDIKARIEASGIPADELNNFAKELGATTINDKVIDAYKKINAPVEEKKDDVSSAHQNKENPSGLDRGDRQGDEPGKIIDELIEIRDQL